MKDRFPVNIDKTFFYNYCSITPALKNKNSQYLDINNLLRQVLL